MNSETLSPASLDSAEYNTENERILLVDAVLRKVLKDTQEQGYGIIFHSGEAITSASSYVEYTHNNLPLSAQINSRRITRDGYQSHRVEIFLTDQVTVTPHLQIHGTLEKGILKNLETDERTEDGSVIFAYSGYMGNEWTQQELTNEEEIKFMNKFLSLEVDNEATQRRMDNSVREALRSPDITEVFWNKNFPDRLLKFFTTETA